MMNRSDGLMSSSDSSRGRLDDLFKKLDRVDAVQRVRPRTTRSLKHRHSSSPPGNFVVGQAECKQDAYRIERLHQQAQEKHHYADARKRLNELMSRLEQTEARFQNSASNWTHQLEMADPHVRELFKTGVLDGDNMDLDTRTMSVNQRSKLLAALAKMRYASEQLESTEMVRSSKSRWRRWGLLGRSSNELSDHAKTRGEAVVRACDSISERASSATTEKVRQIRSQGAIARTMQSFLTLWIARSPPPEHVLLLEMPTALSDMLRSLCFAQSMQ